MRIHNLWYGPSKQGNKMFITGKRAGSGNICGPYCKLQYRYTNQSELMHYVSHIIIRFIHIKFTSNHKSTGSLLKGALFVLISIVFLFARLILPLLDIFVSKIVFCPFSHAKQDINSEK